MNEIIMCKFRMIIGNNDKVYVNIDLELAYCNKC